MSDDYIFMQHDFQVYKIRTPAEALEYAILQMKQDPVPGSQINKLAPEVRELLAQLTPEHISQQRLPRYAVWRTQMTDLGAPRIRSTPPSPYAWERLVFSKIADECRKFKKT